MDDKYFTALKNNVGGEMVLRVDLGSAGGETQEWKKKHKDLDVARWAMAADSVSFRACFVTGTQDGSWRKRQTQGSPVLFALPPGNWPASNANGKDSVPENPAKHSFSAREGKAGMF